MPDLSSLRFASPLGLAFLLSLPVIVWLHLRRRRPRRVVVPSLAPWLALAPSQPPRRRRIPPTVLLLLHLAAATCLALALAAPTLRGQSGVAVDRAVVLDVTTSMAAGDRWAQAVARARALLDATRGQATLVTLEARPRVLAARDADGRAVRAALADLAPGATGAATDAALALAAAAAGPSAEIVGVTDGGIPAASEDGPPARWEVVGGPLDNLAVVDAAVRTAGGETRLFARLASFAEAPAKVPLLLKVDGREIDRRSVDLAPGGTFETVWMVPAGASTAEVGLVGRDDLAADDIAWVPLERSRRLIQLAGESHAMARALAAIPGAEIERVGLGTFHADGSVPLSVFVGATPDPLPPGGVLLVAPSTGAWNDAHAEVVTAAVRSGGDHPLVAGLDLSGVTLVGLSGPTVPDWAEPVLVVQGRTAIYAGQRGASRVLVMAFHPDEGGVADRLAFPLLVARAAAWAVPDTAPVTVPAGSPVPLPDAESIVQMPGGRTWRANGWFEDTRMPGLHAARPAGGSSGHPLRFAVYAGDLVESDLRQRTELPSTLGPGAPAARTDAGGPLRPWLAGLALVLVLVEAVWRARGPA